MPYCLSDASASLVDPLFSGTDRLSMCPKVNVVPLTFKIVNDVLEAELSEGRDSDQGPTEILSDAAACVEWAISEAGLRWTW